jgi:hypothetical protein
VAWLCRDRVTLRPVQQGPGMQKALRNLLRMRQFQPSVGPPIAAVGLGDGAGLAKPGPFATGRPSPPDRRPHPETWKS